MKRLLVLTPTPITGASTRLRLCAYFSALHAAGIEPVMRPFLDVNGFDVLYKKDMSFAKGMAGLRAISNRLLDLRRASRADAVLVHREAALIGPPLFEWLIARVMDRPLLFDFDDAVWVPYTSPTYGGLSRLLKDASKTEFTVRAASLVLAGNPYLSAWAKERNPHVEFFPTVVDTDQYAPKPAANAVPVLGWIGTHSTAPYLTAILPALRRLAERRKFVLRVVGAHIEAPGVEVDERTWALDREIPDFQGLDIGLYPLVEDPWSLGKSALKAIQYMACGVPAVASPVGFTSQVVRDGVTGFLATSDDEWVDRLTQLLDDRALRVRMGEAGRVDAVEKWSLDVYAPRFVDAVRATMR